MHNCSPKIPDYKSKYYTIERDMVNTFYGMYMEKQWGIEVGYNRVPWPIACMQFELAKWQFDNDCGTLCELSRQ